MKTLQAERGKKGSGWADSRFCRLLLGFCYVHGGARTTLGLVCACRISIRRGTPRCDLTAVASCRTRMKSRKIGISWRREIMLCSPISRLELGSSKPPDLATTITETLAEMFPRSPVAALLRWNRKTCLVVCVRREKTEKENKFETLYFSRLHNVEYSGTS